MTAKNILIPAAAAIAGAAVAVGVLLVSTQVQEKGLEKPATPGASSIAAPSVPSSRAIAFADPNAQDQEQLRAKEPVSAPVPVAADAKWVRTANPAGFEIAHPEGWTVETPRPQTVLVRHPGGSFVMIHGFFERNGVKAADWIRKMTGQQGSMFSGARVTSLRQVRTAPDEAAGAFAYEGGEGRAAILCSIDRGSGMMFLMSAPAAEFDVRKQEMARIAQSFRRTARAASETPPAPVSPRMAFTTFTDPKEGSFQVQVPAGWKAQGGLARASAVDVRMHLRLQSPDGRITIQAGDAQIPPFADPNGMAVPMREGTWYSPGYGTNLMVARYQPGLAFAQGYASRFAGSGCRVADQRQRPDLEAIAGRGLQNGPGMSQQYTAGEVSLECNRGGEPVAANVLAGTTRTTMMGMTQWYVTTLVAYLAPRDQTATVNTVVGRLLETLQVNPQWAAAQQRTTGAVSGIVSDTSRQIAKLYSDSYWNQQRTQDRTHQNFSDATRGVQRVRDPYTNEEFEAAAGFNYYWRPLGSDQPVGTNNTDRPNIDVTEMLRVE